MKMLVTADWHLFLNSGELKRDDIAKTCDDIIRMAVREKVDLFINAGDVYHKELINQEQVAVMVWMCNILEQYHIKSYILVGNHDEIAQKDRGNSLKALSFFPYRYVTVIDEIGFCHFPSEKFAFFFVPHVSKAKHDNKPPQQVCLEAWAKRKAVVRDDPIIVIAHTEIEGATHGTEDMMLAKKGFVLPQEIINDPQVRRVFCGHIHKHQDIGKVTIIGSPVYVDASEVNDTKGVIIYEI